MVIDRESIIRYFRDFEALGLPQVIKRDYVIPDADRPVVLIGPRRVGKTYLLFQKMHELLENGEIIAEQLLYLNFEDVALMNITAQDFPKILEIYWGLNPDAADRSLYLFLDEPQEIPRWENGVISLMKYDVKIYITGSSSKLMSHELATAFRGRATPVYISTLSFSEFLRFKRLNPKKRGGSKQEAKLKAALDEYLMFGGYPEVVLTSDIRQKWQILRTYLDLVIYRDLVERFNIKNQYLLKLFVGTLMNHIGQQININKIARDYKSRNIRVSPETLFQYLDFLEDAGIFRIARRYDTSFRRSINAQPKIYVHDLGLYTLYHHERTPLRWENLVFNRLYDECRKFGDRDLYYWRTPNQYEIDFISISAKKVYDLVQVFYNAEKPGTLEREWRAMIKGRNDLENTAGLEVEKCYFITGHPPDAVLEAVPKSSRPDSLKKDDVVIMDLLDWLLYKEENLRK